MTAPYRPAEGLNAFVTTMPPTVQPGPALSGVGSPEGVVPANPGTAYDDTASGWRYVKFAGVAELGWKHVGDTPPTISGASVVTQVFSGTGSPVGVVFPQAANAFYTQTDSVPPDLIWNWHDGAWH